MVTQEGDNEDDDIDLDDWTPVSRGRGQEKRSDESSLVNQSNKRRLEENSLNEGCRVFHRKVVREEFKIILTL